MCSRTFDPRLRERHLQSDHILSFHSCIQYVILDIQFIHINKLQELKVYVKDFILFKGIYSHLGIRICNAPTPFQFQVLL